MRLLALALFGILVFAGPSTAAADATLPDVTDLSRPAPDGLPPASPFLQADPAGWLPALRAHGTAAAYRAAVAADGEAEAEVEEDGPAVPVHRNILPLGDADRDGRHDVIVVSHDVEEEETTFTALGGAREDDVLWTRRADDDEHMYLIGDVDEDGVLDIAFAQDVDSGYDEASGAYWIETRHRLLSGRDLAVLADTVLETTERWTGDEGPVPFLLVGQEQRTRETDLPFVVDLWDVPGYAVATLHITDHQESEGVLITTSARATYHFGMSLSRHDLDGMQLWQAGDRETLLHDLLDIDGDGQRDPVFGRGFFHQTWSFGTEDYLASILGRDGGAEGRDVGVLVVDAADGTTVWEKEFHMDGDVFALTTLGSIYGDGPTLGVLAFVARSSSGGVFGQYDFEMRTDLRFIDAAGGEVRDTHTLEDRLLLPFAHGDADGDGRDELLLYSLRTDGRPTLAATDAALNATWKMRMSADAWRLGDLDADGVPDILLIEDDDIAAYRGTDASKMWGLDVEDAVATTVAYDLDLDGGRDVAVLRMEETGRRVDGGSVEFLNGADGTTIWTKPVYNGSMYKGVSAQRFHVSSYGIGDLDGDGATDPFVRITGSCDEKCGREGKAHGLDAVMGLDAIDAHAFLRFDNMPVVPGAEVLDVPGIIGPAGRLMESRLDKGMPGLELALLAFALVAVAAMARRR